MAIQVITLSVITRIKPMPVAGRMRRKFFDAVKAAGANAAPGLAHEAIDIIKDLYKIEKEA
ncbi:hypothetical protein MASR1M12_22390 [Erysipelotrichia bacterium]